MKKVYLIIAIIILSFVSIFLGAKNINFADLINGNLESVRVMTISRFPRLIAILVAGVGMSICGLIMQQISQNKFISPTTGATIDSAQLGLVISMLVFPSASTMQKGIIAFIFALIGTFMFMKLVNVMKFKNIIFVPLVGIMLGNIIGSITKFLGYQFDMIQNVESWMQGNFSMVLKGNYELIFISIPFIIFAIIYANKFTLVGMGKDFATNLGTNYNRIVNIGLTIVALVSVSIIIIAGDIPFIGLIIPNVVSMYKGDNVQKNILDTALVGALFVLVCDIISRLIVYPYEISVGLTIGIIGSIIFLYMITRRKVYA